MTPKTQINKDTALADKERLRVSILKGGDALLTSGDVAAILNTTKVTIQQWANKGLLECRRLPGSENSPRRFTYEQVRSFIKAHKIPINRFSEVMLTTQEIATAAQVSTFTVINWIDSKALPSFWMVSRRLTFFKDALNFFEEHKMEDSRLYKIAKSKGPGAIQSEHSREGKKKRKQKNKK